MPTSGLSVTTSLAIQAGWLRGIRWIYGDVSMCLACSSKKLRVSGDILCCVCRTSMHCAVSFMTVETEYGASGAPTVSTGRVDRMLCSFFGQILC